MLIYIIAAVAIIGILIFVNSKVKSDCNQECSQGRNCTCRNATLKTENQSSE